MSTILKYKKKFKMEKLNLELHKDSWEKIIGQQEYILDSEEASGLENMFCFRSLDLDLQAG